MSQECHQGLEAEKKNNNIQSQLVMLQQNNQNICHYK